VVGECVPELVDEPDGLGEESANIHFGVQYLGKSYGAVSLNE
jgi:hypothetical protein